MGGLGGLGGFRGFRGFKGRGVKGVYGVWRVLGVGLEMQKDASARHLRRPGLTLAAQTMPLGLKVRQKKVIHLRCRQRSVDLALPAMRRDLRVAMWS